MTKNQIEILVHTKKNRFYGTTLNCQDGTDCEVLVEMGYMTKRKAPSWTVDDFIYYITEAGEKALKGVGE